MASPREIYEKDSSKNLRVHATHAVGVAGGGTIEVTAAMSFDFDASAKFGLLYIPESPIVPDVIAHYLGNIDVLLNVGKDLIVEHGHAGTDERIGSGDLLRGA